MTNDIEKHSQEFDLLTQARHEDGYKEYGDLKFLENELFGMIYEELADAANYLRYQFIKLRLVEEQVNATGIDLTKVEFDANPEGFTPTKESSRFFGTSG